jgi:2-polyprenyl-3-methyl-5-hydroxy-6-metoxy-1,4-benzoquinol methylase
MTSFPKYRGKERSYWEKHHERYKDSIIAVGRGNTTPDVNRREYHRAKLQFVDMVKGDFPGSRHRLRVMDFGFGHGHYARACHELGFGSYHGLDFASKTHPDLGPDYVFETADISTPRAPDPRHHLVICIDTIFHVVDEEKFASALNNIVSHAAPQSRIYITGLFTPKAIEPYVLHRPVSAFEPLQLLSMETWRDNKIARFRLP